jgi:hypothetical protein
MSEHVLKRTAAIAVTVWLLGWAPSIYFSQAVQGGPDNSPQLYAIWIILMPTFGTIFCAAVYGLWEFYKWALGKPSHPEVEARIDELERELGIGP